jgi:hypothetical protein
LRESGDLWLGVSLSQSKAAIIKIFDRLIQTFITDWFAIGMILAMLYLMAEHAMYGT